MRRFRLVLGVLYAGFLSGCVRYADQNGYGTAIENSVFVVSEESISEWRRREDEAAKRMSVRYLTRRAWSALKPRVSEYEFEESTADVMLLMHNDTVAVARVVFAFGADHPVYYVDATPDGAVIDYGSLHPSPVSTDGVGLESGASPEHEKEQSRDSDGWISVRQVNQRVTSHLSPLYPDYDFVNATVAVWVARHKDAEPAFNLHYFFEPGRPVCHVDATAAGEVVAYDFSVPYQPFHDHVNRDEVGRVIHISP